MLQAPARIHTGSFKIRHMREHMLQAPARIHTRSFKIRHMREHMLQAPGFMVDLLDVGNFARLSHSHLIFVMI